ncbi:MAG: hypothetical protein HYX89_07345 [Chloroflexi bacterium]|nr:hypothetical protein [Chloroflexota bacterium]
MMIPQRPEGGGETSEQEKSPAMRGFELLLLGSRFGLFAGRPGALAVAVRLKALVLDGLLEGVVRFRVWIQLLGTIFWTGIHALGDLRKALGRKGA